jgi:1-deoxy-D-xylulose-5-phosphate reductoisomerase
MKKKIAILGSTGSIGSTSLNIFSKNKKKFSIILLSANSNYSSICNQIQKYRPKFFIINNFDVFKKVKKKYMNYKIKILNNFSEINLKKIKFDITISSIVGIAGLYPTIKFITHSKKLLLANKETIICGWHIIKKLSKKNNTKVIPIDSEHYSIDQLTKNSKDEDIEKIFLTASGGPFLNKSLKSFNSISAVDAAKHPKWKMGKKISIDSSNLMNKVLEVIEAYRIFPFNPKKFEIIIHPQSLIHAIVLFKNGQTKFLYHETDMRIPIANAIYENNFDLKNILYPKKDIIKRFEGLKFKKLDKKRFPIVTLLSKYSSNYSGPIILNASNEVLVSKFINGEISFKSIYIYLKAVLRHKDYKKYAIKRSPNLNEIYEIDSWARNKIFEIIKKKK